MRPPMVFPVQSRPTVDPKRRSGEFSRRTSSGTVRTDVHDGIWVLTLDRPPANAVDLVLVADLTAAFEKAAGSIGCRGIVITGAGRMFCGGIDTRLVPNYDRRQQSRMLSRINSLARIAYGCPRPTVAAINGHAIGAGLVLAMFCDFRVATDLDTRLGLTEVAAGIPFPAGPLIVVHSELSPATARRLVLEGNLYSPRDAAVSEIVDEIVEPAELVSAAIERARRLAAAPGYATVKRQLRAEALDKLTALVERGTDPLTTRWV